MAFYLQAAWAEDAVMTSPDSTPTPVSTHAESVRGNPSGKSHDRNAHQLAPPRHKKAPKVDTSTVTAETLLSYADAGDVFSVSDRTIRRLRKHGLKPTVMVGTRPRFRFADVVVAFRAKAAAERVK